MSGAAAVLVVVVVVVVVLGHNLSVAAVCLVCLSTRRKVLVAQSAGLRPTGARGAATMRETNQCLIGLS